MVATDPCLSAKGGIRADVETVAELALFSGLDDDTLALLVTRLGVVSFPAGASIFEEGDLGRAMYVVLSGNVRLERKSSGEQVEVAHAERGDWFGEQSLLDVMARSASARAGEECLLLAMCPTDLSAVYQANTKMYAMLVMNMARQLSRKLRCAEGRLCSTLAAERVDKRAEDVPT